MGSLKLGETPTVTVSTSYIRCSTVTAVLGLTGYYCTMNQIANVAPFSLTFHSADTAWFSQVLYLCNLSFSKVGDEVFINELVILAENTGLRWHAELWATWWSVEEKATGCVCCSWKRSTCMNSIKKIEIIRYSPVCAYNLGDLSNCPTAYRAFSIYYKWWNYSANILNGEAMIRRAFLPQGKTLLPVNQLDKEQKLEK